jgi:hypothetical protein
MRISSTSCYEAQPATSTFLEKKGDNRVLAAGFALAATLYLMYSPVFLTDYLMNDEWEFIGSHQGLRESATNAFFFWGRGLFGIYSTLVYRFARYDPFRVQLVRFVNFTSLVIVALLLFIFLAKKSDKVWFSSLAVLFLFSTASFQELMAYSLQLISNTLPAMWFSLLAFYAGFLVDDRRFSRPLRLSGVFLLLLLAMQSTQTFAFFCTVPLTYLTLSDWNNQRRKIFEFVALALLVFLLSSLSYRAGLHYWHSRGFRGYKLGEAAVDAGHHPLRLVLHTFNPVTYWSVFEIWSYPFPLNSLSVLAKMKFAIALCLMGVWVVMVVWAITIEARRTGVAMKWFAILVYLGFGAVFIIADSPLVTIEHRPHMVVTFLGIVILSAAYSLEVVINKYPALGGNIPKMVAIIVVLIAAWAAQAGTLRGYVVDRMRLIDFIRTQLAAQNPATYRNIIVILPAARGPEPREFWVGRGFQDRYHMTREGAYRYALATMGVPPESKNITFVERTPKQAEDASAIVDWRKHLLASSADPNFGH